MAQITLKPVQRDTVSSVYQKPWIYLPNRPTIQAFFTNDMVVEIYQKVHCAMYTQANTCLKFINYIIAV